MKSTTFQFLPQLDSTYRPADYQEVQWDVAGGYAGEIARCVGYQPKRALDSQTNLGAVEML